MDEFEYKNVPDIDLENAVGRTVEFEYYPTPDRHSKRVCQLKGELIEVIPGQPHAHCRAKLDNPFHGKQILTFSAGQITNRLELIGEE
jgi:hypothetical protein